MYRGWHQNGCFSTISVNLECMLRGKERDKKGTATDCKPSPGARQLGRGRGSQGGNTVNARKFQILSCYRAISRKFEKGKGKIDASIADSRGHWLKAYAHTNKPVLRRTDPDVLHSFTNLCLQ